MIQLSSLPAAIPHGPVRAAPPAPGAAGSFALPRAKTAAAEAGEILAPSRQILAAPGKALPEIDIADMSMGLGFANAVDPTSGHSTPALGQFLSLLLTLLFLAVDGHLVLVDLVVRSYEAMPPGAWIAPERLLSIALFGGYAFLAGLLLALPVGFLLLCLNVVVGMPTYQRLAWSWLFQSIPPR